eukprot:5648216-Alexandrium_andersonii.AAC.1
MLALAALIASWMAPESSPTHGLRGRLCAGQMVSRPSLMCSTMVAAWSSGETPHGTGAMHRIHCERACCTP